MPRPRKDGPKRVRRTLSDGTTWNFLYDRRTGAAMGKERVVAAANASPAGSLGALIEDYLGSTDFAKRAPSTQNLYRGTLAYMKTTVGDLTIQEITPGNVQEIKEALAHKPYLANQILVMLSILFKRAIRRDLIKYNPAASPGKLETRKRTEVWSREMEDEVVTGFPWPLNFAFMLLLYTCQRLGDILTMQLSQIMEHNGRLYIALKQQKTQELVGVPVHKRLEPFLRQRLEQTIDSTLLITSPTGLQWARRNFSRSWDRIMRRLGRRRARQLFRLGWAKSKVRAELQAEHRQRRDLRRTGVVRLAETGAPLPAIVGITGWSTDYCANIVDTYLPRRTEIALVGIEMWEAGGDTVKVVRLADEAVARERSRSASVSETNRKLELLKRFSRNKKVQSNQDVVARPTGLEPVTHSLEVFRSRFRNQ